MADQNTKPVWISCRAHGKGCGGNQAIIVSAVSHNPTPNQSVSGQHTVGGAFEPVAGGKHIRYKCTTCGGLFHITQ